MVRTFASLFTGGGLADLGARAAGLDHVWGVELDAPICVHANAQGFETLLSDVRLIDYAEMPRVDWLHMSPPCINASTAKQDAGETELDRDLARACVRAIDALRPPRVSLENVYFYRTFEAFEMITAALERNGYHVEWWHLNAADYGVPQTRKRLILVASLDHRPVRPVRTHSRYSEQRDFFTQPWNGWYGAIEDMLDTLPPSEFAAWQLERLERLDLNSLVGNQYDSPTGSVDRKPQIAGPNMPAPSVMAGDWNKIRAFLAVQNGEHSESRTDGEPAPTVSNQAYGRSRAFLMRSDNSQRGSTREIREPAEPAMTVRASRLGLPRAFIEHPTDMRSFPTRDEAEPMFVVTATHGNNWTPRAWLDRGRVVAMTVRALARFQSVPDSYQLPEKNGLGAKIIGNGVPPLLMQRVIEANS